MWERRCQQAQQQVLARTRAASGRADLPAWISPVPHSTAANPRHHEYLAESTALIAGRVSVLAERTAEMRPEWSRTLGEAPTDPALRAQWQRQLAVVAAYRDQYRVTDYNVAQPAGPYIEEGRTGHHAYWTATEAAITARRIATSNTPAAASADSEQQALRRLAADVYRTLPDADQTEILRTVAARTGATWLTGRPRLDDATLAQQHIAEHVSTALAERRQLTTEATQPEQQVEGRRQPTLPERRRAGRQAERQAHRDQFQQRAGQPATRTARPVPGRRPEPVEQRQVQAPAQRPAVSQQQVQPPQAHQDQRGPRIR